jgi:hypothetical protein
MRQLPPVAGKSFEKSLEMLFIRLERKKAN